MALLALQVEKVLITIRSYFQLVVAHRIDCQHHFTNFKTFMAEMVGESFLEAFEEELVESFMEETYNSIDHIIHILLAFLLVRVGLEKEVRIPQYNYVFIFIKCIFVLQKVELGSPN